MKRKVKLAFSVMGMTLSVFLLLLGVYALSERTVGISGSITFTSTALYFDYDVYQTSAEGYSSETTPIPYGSTAIKSGSFDNTTEEKDFDISVPIGEVNLNDSNNAFAYKVVLTSQEKSKTLRVEIDILDLSEFDNYLTSKVKHNDLEVSTYVFLIEPEASATFEFIFEIDPLWATSPITIDFGSAFTVTVDSEYITNETFVMSYDSSLGGYVVHSTMISFTEAMLGIQQALASGSFDIKDLFHTYTAFPSEWDDGVHGNKPVVKIGNPIDFANSIKITDYEAFEEHVDFVWGVILNLTEYEYLIYYYLQDLYDDLKSEFQLSKPNDAVLIERYSKFMIFNALVQTVFPPSPNIELVSALLFFITNLDISDFGEPQKNYYILELYDLNLFFFLGIEQFYGSYLRSSYKGGSPIQFHEGLKVIGKNAFGYFDFMDEMITGFGNKIIFPSSLEKIEEGAFSYIYTSNWVFSEVNKTLTIEASGLDIVKSDYATDPDPQIEFFNETVEYFDFDFADIIRPDDKENITVIVPSGSLAAYTEWIDDTDINIIERD